MKRLSKFSRMVRRGLLLSASLLLIAGVALAACDDDDDPQTRPATAQSADQVEDADSPSAEAEPAAPAAIVPLTGPDKSAPFGHATIQAQADGAAAILLELTDLTPDAAYTAHLLAGSCDLTSASSGRLGDFTADDDGAASIEIGQVIAGATGTPTPLTLALLGDGDHLVLVRDAAGAVAACGEIPGFARVVSDAEGEGDGPPSALTIRPPATTPGVAFWGDVWLLPVDGSGAEVVAHLEAEAMDAPLDLRIEALMQPASTYVVLLHTGSCAQPSASSGRISELTTDGAGRAQLQASEVRAGAVGEATPLTLELLADGEHLLRVLDADGQTVACGEIPTIGRL